MTDDAQFDNGDGHTQIKFIITILIMISNDLSNYTRTYLLSKFIFAQIRESYNVNLIYSI